MSYSEKEIKIAAKKMINAKQAVLAHTRIVGNKIDFTLMQEFYSYVSGNIKYELTLLQNESIQIARLIRPIAKVRTRIIYKIIFNSYNQFKKGGPYDKNKIN